MFGAFFKSLNMPVELKTLVGDKSKLESMAKGAVTFGNIGGFRVLNESDVLNILNNSFDEKI